MKQIVAIVKPYLAEKVLESLKRAPLEAVSVREVKGYGRQKSYLDQYGDSEYSLAFLPKVEIILWVDDSRAEEILRKIVDVARTGRMGDGKIFVLPAAQIDRRLSFSGRILLRRQKSDSNRAAVDLACSFLAVESAAFRDQDTPAVAQV